MSNGRISLVFAACLAVGACCGGDDDGGKDGAGDGGGEATPSLEDQVASSQPLSPSPGSAEVGDHTFTAEVCTIEGAEFVGDSSMSMFESVVVADGRLFVADGSPEVRAFTLGEGDGCTLTLDTSFGDGGVKTLGHDIEWLSVDDKGVVIGSNGIFSAYAFDGDGGTDFTCDTKGYVELHGSGKWGIAPWVNSNVKLVSVAEGACAAEDWVLTALSDDEKRKGIFASVDTAGMTGDTILIGGSLSKKEDPDSPHVVAGFDKGGKERFRFGGGGEAGSDQNFGWIHAVSGCKPGICVLDSNYRRLTVWSSKGEFVGSADLSDLLDLSYPWIADFHIADDGQAYFVAANDRKDSDVAEGVIYRVSGLGTAAKAKATSGGTSTPRTGGKMDKGGRNPGARQPVTRPNSGGSSGGGRGSGGTTGSSSGSSSGGRGGGGSSGRSK